MHVFLMYFFSKSFSELKSAIKNQFFLYLGGLGAKLSFVIKKKMGKNIGTGGLARGKIFSRLAIYTWVGLSDMTQRYCTEAPGPKPNRS